MNPISPSGNASALIVARPGPLRRSMQSLVTAMPEIALVTEVRDAAAVLQMEPGCRQDLVLIDAGLPEIGLAELLHQVKSHWALARTLVFVENGDQELTAVAARADAVIYQGCRAVRLYQLIAEQLATLHPETKSRSEAHE